MNIAIEQIENGFLVTQVTPEAPFIYAAEDAKGALRLVVSLLKDAESKPKAKPKVKPKVEEDDDVTVEVSDDDLPIFGDEEDDL